MSERMTDRIKNRLTDQGNNHPDGGDHHHGTAHHGTDHSTDRGTGHTNGLPADRTADGAGAADGWGPGASADTAVTPVRPLSEQGVPVTPDNHDLRNQQDRSAGQGIRDGQVFQDSHDTQDSYDTQDPYGTQGGHGATGAHPTPGSGTTGPTGASAATGMTGTTGTSAQGTGAHAAPHESGHGSLGDGQHGTAVGGPFGGVTGGRDSHGAESYGGDTHGVGTHSTHSTGTHGTGTHGAGTHGTGTHGGATHGSTGTHGGAHHSDDDGPGETLHRLLPHEDTEKLNQRLHHAVGGFVDEPRGSVGEAEKVLDEVAERLTSCLTARRRTLRTAWQSLGDETADPAADTEQLRLILRDYRELTGRLLRL
ncbi:hypothetical protein [Streptomyces sp. NPDC005012]|uniref:hypothetical protein n=1 Tax=Streptomyces sp. NPDC005012 TaxID=3154558 RepID=UPI0033B2971E